MFYVAAKAINTADKLTGNLSVSMLLLIKYVLYYFRLRDSYGCLVLEC